MHTHGCTSVQHICAMTPNDRDLLVQASRLYYELGETQNAVADRLGVTRPQVSRLLKRARAEGIVEIRIVDRDDRRVARRRRPATALRPRRRPPRADARRPRGPHATDGRSARRAGPARHDPRRAIVGIGDGASVGAVADALDDAATPVRATVVPLAGGYWSTGPEREPFRRIADALRRPAARPHGARAARRRGRRSERSRRMPASAPSSTCGIGSTSRCSGSAAGRGARRPSGDEVAAELETAGAVGEILIAPFDIDGVFVCPALRERVLAFDARALGRVPVVDRGRGGRAQGPADPGRAPGRRPCGRS